MDIPNFDDLPITTMTLVISLTNEIDISSAYHLLPITRIAVPPTRDSAKCKLPHCPIPGSILSIRHHNNVRGIIRSKTRPFKNAVTIDISTSRKNISLKLSPFSIQMCGASSKEDGVEAATHVLDHLRRIQGYIDILKESETTERMIRWIEEQTRGEKTTKSTPETVDTKTVVLNVDSSIPEYLIIAPTMTIPKEFDNEIVEFLLSLADDFRYHGDYVLQLGHVRALTTIIKLPLQIGYINEAMVNYNYSLGFEVDRVKLNEYINGRNGFISRYNNALVNCVTIELVYDPPENSHIKRRKNKTPHHTFLVYRSGSVTESGPGPDLMRPAYYNFRQTIEEIRNLITYRP